MGEKIRLLFVDDEEEFVYYMAKRLRRRGFDVHAYTNPVEALEKTEEQSYDVGLLDLKMPEMDGEELLHRLKQRDPSIEVIILTGHGSMESVFRSAKVGAYEYLLKPCNFDELGKSINNAYAKRIRSLGREKAGQVDDLMKQAGELPPPALLERLKKIHDGMGKSISAAAFVEGRDSPTASGFLGKKTAQYKK